jgi:DNA-binding response OmpR family regulator
LKKARTLQPDLVILDLILPELDGFAVCEALKRGADTATIPVIIMTGLTSEFTRYAGMESGADEYITKPISPEQLVPRIKQRLLRARTKEAADACKSASATPR